ncbi:MAG TPA: hypothetical protein VJM31_17340 [Vicinamibacterales bacterium]|nr:hypothetical protein [Vicinamibacterales bacterium]
MNMRMRLTLLRLGAVVLMVVSVYLLNRVMLRLPWQVDCIIAGVAALAFAYRYERQESH